MRVVRSHWQIENGLHYRRDVTLHEDASAEGTRPAHAALPHECRLCLAACGGHTRSLPTAGHGCGYLRPCSEPDFASALRPGALCAEDGRRVAARWLPGAMERCAGAPPLGSRPGWLASALHQNYCFSQSALRSLRARSTRHRASRRPRRQKYAGRSARPAPRTPARRVHCCPARLAAAQRPRFPFDPVPPR
jgi:hypothetical protein